MKLKCQGCPSLNLRHYSGWKTAHLIQYETTEAMDRKYPPVIHYSVLDELENS